MGPQVPVLYSEVAGSPEQAWVQVCRLQLVDYMHLNFKLLFHVLASWALPVSHKEKVFEVLQIAVH